MSLQNTTATFLGLLSAVGIATLLASPATASWVRVKTNQNNDVYSVDVDSIKGRGRFRYFWSHVVFGSPIEDGGRVAHRAVYYIFVDCKNKVYQVRFTQFRDKNNQLIQDYIYGEESSLVTPRPGSSEEASLKFVCSIR
jgi:hypothetical protein